MRGPGSTAGPDCLRTEGVDASEFTTRHLAGQTVTISFDDLADGVFGRLLVHIEFNGENFNDLLGLEAFARV